MNKQKAMLNIFTSILFLLTLTLLIPATSVAQSHQLTTTLIPLVSTTPTSESSQSELAGKIVYIGEDDQIFIMNADGSNPVRLTNDPSQHLQPALSPNGEKIAYVAYENQNTQIYVMNVDGSEPLNLTNNHICNRSPAWSADGTQIAFVSGNGTGFCGQNVDTDIYVMNADGSNRRLLLEVGSPMGKFAWSPDGTRIAFVRGYTWNTVSGRRIAFELLVTNVNEPFQVSGGLQIEEACGVAWSPDGSTLAYALKDENKITILEIDGTEFGEEQILPIYGCNPTWSPDGDWLAISENISILPMIVVTSDGLTMMEMGNGKEPSWGP